MRQLQTAPFRIDAQAVARGMLDLFSDEERAILRFGMLPAKKMEVLQRALRDKFLEQAEGSRDGDEFVAWTTRTGERRVVEFKMSRLVAEAVHEVCVCLYEIGDLVV